MVGLSAHRTHTDWFHGSVIALLGFVCLALKPVGHATKMLHPTNTVSLADDPLNNISKGECVQRRGSLRRLQGREALYPFKVFLDFVVLELTAFPTLLAM